MSQFTYRQSQRATTLEVTVCLSVSFACWFTDWPIMAWFLLILAALSLLAHFNRRYKDDPS